MPSDLQNENIIRGNCAFFVCRCCQTKYGWAHQVWCDDPSLTEPRCHDCRYFNARAKRCVHPARKAKGRDLLNERDQRPL